MNNWEMLPNTHPMKKVYQLDSEVSCLLANLGDQVKAIQAGRNAGNSLDNLINLNMQLMAKVMEVAYKDANRRYERLGCYPDKAIAGKAYRLMNRFNNLKDETGLI